MKEKTTPPSWATRFLHWFIKKDYYEDIQGDLEEEYQLLLNSKGLKRARRWYSWQIIKLFRPEMARKIEVQNSIEKETIMFKNYVKIGLRNLWKHKSSTAINVIGLSSGLAAFILIALFVKDELSYDKHFADADQIHRVTIKNFDQSGDISRHWAFASAGHAERLKADYAEVSHAARIQPWAFPDIQYGDKKLASEPVIFASEDIFKIFSFPFIEGKAETAFEDVFSLVLTESTAIKIFGNDWRDQRVVGKQVTLSQGDRDVPFKITGVMEDMPDQQHFHFDYLAPIRFLEQVYDEATLENVRGNYNWLTYIKLSSGADLTSLTKQANDEFWDKYIGTFSTGEKAKDFYAFEFQPILDIHLQSNLEGEYETNGSLQQVYIFSIVGILLLLVACVNYMNIATSHYSRRMKEVGVRKVIGAFKSALVKQFLTESTLVTFISLPISILLIYWALPYLNDFMSKQLVFNPLAQWDMLSLLLGLLLGVGLIAGFYPAIFLSKINLVQALKGEQAMNAGKWNFRSWLVTFQYAVTIGLIFAIVIIDGQMNFIRNSDPGYDREHIVRVNLPSNVNFETYKNELLSHPNIENASYSSRIPTGRLADSWGSKFFKADSAVVSDFRLPVVSVDHDFLETFGIDLLAGEDFRPDMLLSLDFTETKSANYIINETAARAFGFTEPGQIVGEKIAYGLMQNMNVTEGRIIGVMEDFHFESLHSKIVPMLIICNDNFRGISLKISPNDIPETLEHIESTFAQFDQENTVRYNFVDDLFNDQYREEKRLSTMIKVFAALAVLIGCLGLFGMVGFIIETKMKEIGVRKVLGASAINIWMKISNRFLILIGIAFLVAAPVGFYLMNGWLKNFVYRTNITFWHLLIPVLIVGGITFLTTSYQIRKAATENPVSCLKDE